MTPTIAELRALLHEALRVTPSQYLISPALCHWDEPTEAERRAIAAKLRIVIEAHTEARHAA